MSALVRAAAGLLTQGWSIVPMLRSSWSGLANITATRTHCDHLRLCQALANHDALAACAHGKHGPGLGTAHHLPGRSGAVREEVKELLEICDVSCQRIPVAHP